MIMFILFVSEWQEQVTRCKQYVQTAWVWGWRERKARVFLGVREAASLVDTGLSAAYDCWQTPCEPQIYLTHPQTRGCGQLQAASDSCFPPPYKGSLPFEWKQCVLCVCERDLMWDLYGSLTYCGISIIVSDFSSGIACPCLRWHSLIVWFSSIHFLSFC